MARGVVHQAQAEVNAGDGSMTTLPPAPVGPQLAVWENEGGRVLVR